jgi:Periplasmic binding protein-like domain
MLTQGYRDALAHHGLVEHPELVSAPPSAWIPEQAATSVTRMLTRDEPPDAIAAANDDFAVAALSALAESGVVSPEHIPVVGFDEFTNIRTHDLGFDSGSGEDAAAVRRTVNVRVVLPDILRSPLAIDVQETATTAAQRDR